MSEKIRLSGIYNSHKDDPRLRKTQRDWGNCLSEALKSAGYEVENLPPWVHKEDMPKLFRELGLIFQGEGNFSFNKGERFIVMYETDPGVAHVEYTNHLGNYIGAKNQF